MTTSLRFLLASLALSAATLARAESAPTAPARALSPILVALDGNHDGTLSATEIAAAPVTLTALDLNEDGMISPDERSTEGRVRRGGTSFNVVLALDANHDGDLQSLEIAHAISSLKRLDLNGDGRLTPDELRSVTIARN